MSRIRILAVAAALASALLLAPDHLLDEVGDLFRGRPQVDVHVDGPQPTRAEVRDLLADVDVRQRAERAGYERDCGPGAGCSFGVAWSDDTTAPWGHDGCDTRNQMLAASLTDVRFRPGTHDCVVISGTLLDPFTGTSIDFTKEHAAEVQVDHVFPLALAWDQGAAEWPQARRDRFANDPANLIVVSGPANASKGDSGPGEWLPINAAYRCAYVGRYLQVAKQYDLPVTPADHAAASDIMPSCPTTPGTSNP